MSFRYGPSGYPRAASLALRAIHLHAGPYNVSSHKFYMCRAQPLECADNTTLGSSRTNPSTASGPPPFRQGRLFAENYSRKNKRISKFSKSACDYCEYNKVPGYPTAIFDCVIGSGSYYFSFFLFINARTFKGRPKRLMKPSESLWL